MRIITGEYRGRKLETPIGYDVRPTTDKVKEAIFNLLQNDMYDAVCVDLFAGTGSLGLEALSRGARRCYFCDNARASLNLIKTNIKICGASDKSVVLAGDYTKTLTRIKEQADIFFLDPPYASGVYEKCLELIEDLDLLTDEGIIVAEHDKYDEMPEQVGNLVKVKARRYGKILVSIYQYACEENLVEDTENDTTEEEE